MTQKKSKALNPKGCSMASGIPTPKENIPYSHKYDQSLCMRVSELYKDGKSDSQVCVALGIARSTFYDWVKDKPEFCKAVEEGRSLSESWWIDVAQQAVTGNIKSDSKIWFANMKNRFKWRDNPHDPKQEIDQKKLAQDIIDGIIKDREQPY